MEKEGKEKKSGIMKKEVEWKRKAKKMIIMKGKNKFEEAANKEEKIASIPTSFSKGQMFIISSIFVVAGLFMLFSVVGSPSITEEKRFQETQFLDKTAKNILTEYKYALGMASSQSQPNASAMDYLGNFSSFLKSDTNMNAFYTVIFFNGTSQSYSLSLGNYMGNNMSFNVTAASSVPSSVLVNVPDKGSSLVAFTPTTTGTIVVNVSYAGIRESIPVQVSGSNFIIGLFDLEVEDAGSSIRVKDTYNRTW